MNRLQNIWRRSSFASTSWIWIEVICSVLLAVILLMVWNTAELKKVLEDSTSRYVDDVSFQLTSDISFHFSSSLTQLEQFADSISQLPDEQKDEFIARKTRLSDFDRLLLLERDSLEDDWKKTPEVLNAFSGEATVTSYLDGQRLLFAVPVDRANQVLVGIRSKENVQSLIQPSHFNSSGMSCIVDHLGQVIISPTDLKPFLQLEDIFLSDEDVEAKNSLLQMTENLKLQKSGVFHFTAVDGTELVLAYHPLDVNNWSLLTLVPANLIIDRTQGYIFRTILIIGGGAAAFLLLLISLLRFYQTNTARLTQIALTDPLTGGKNNAAFQMEFNRLVPEMEPSTYAVAILNVKDFKMINENYGTAVGDDTLKYIDRQLQTQMRPDEFAARSNADQFFLCLHESDPECIQNRLENIRAAIVSFNKYSDIHYSLILEMGVCLVDNPDTDVTILQDRARLACTYQSETAICSFYDTALTQQLKMEQELNALFEEALAQKQFQVYLQPKVRLKNQSLGGAEALVRWFHPQRGMISPGDFIPLFEKNGNICKLDLYMFEEVCRLIHRWMEEGRQLIPISVNLSRTHFKHLNFLQEFSARKKHYGIPDGIIEFELTESIFFNEQQRELVRDTVVQMHQLGFLCSLDDFGMGYSALGLMKELDTDTIKLDRYFFGDISNLKAQKIIASFLNLAEQLGIETVAEGIETQEQLEFLQRAGCGLIQGFLFSRPLSIADFEDWSRDFAANGPKIKE